VPKRRCLVLCAVTALLFAVLSTLVAAQVGPLLRCDAAISSAALRVALGHPGWRAFALAITTTGGTAPVTVAAVAAVLLLVMVGRRRDAVFVAVSMAGSAAVRLLVLNAIARPRPTHQLAPTAGFSFPSGHTTGSAAAALTALVVLWPLLHGRLRAIVAGAVGAWAAAVGLSRVALVVHWPTDVLGGWLLAITVVLAASVVLRRPEQVAEPAPPGRIHRLDGQDREGGDQQVVEGPSAGQAGRITQRLHRADDDPIGDLR
jgi:undecaprenyl-diphosphatase